MSSDRFACIEYNITNSSWHFGPNGSLWTGLSPPNIIWTSASLRLLNSTFLKLLFLQAIPFNQIFHEMKNIIFKWLTNKWITHLLENLSSFEGFSDGCAFSFNLSKFKKGCCGHDCMLVGFTTTFATSAYHH
jgi:hypothetical protein